MAQDLMDLPPEGTAPPPDMSPANSMLKNLPKNNALFVCLYQNGNTIEIVVKEARLHELKAIRLMTGLI